MRSVAPVLTVLVLPALFAFGACAGPATSHQEMAPDAAADASFREPYTRTRTIDVDGEVRGYLVSYDPIPLHAAGTVSRSLPEDSHRVLDAEFRDVGFLTSTFEVFRHGPHGTAESLGVAKSVPAGLALFFRGTTVRLDPLTAGGQPD